MARASVLRLGLIQAKAPLALHGRQVLCIFSGPKLLNSRVLVSLARFVLGKISIEPQNATLGTGIGFRIRDSI